MLDYNIIKVSIYYKENRNEERIRTRVLKGGHGIPEQAIERRYYESLDNLKNVLGIYNEIIYMITLINLNM